MLGFWALTLVARPLASPCPIAPSKSPLQSQPLEGPNLLENLSTIISEWAVSDLVLGLPISMDGREGPACQSVRQFAKNLDERFEMCIAFWDERLSTAAMERFLINEANLSRKRRSEVIDKLAAVYILQGALDYLARECSTSTTALV